MWDNSTLLHVLSKNGTVQMQTNEERTPYEGKIQTSTAGGLWGAYLMTVAHFCKELAS